MKFLFNNFLQYFFIYLGFLFLSIYVWLNRYFGNVDIEQFLFFLLLGFDGLLDTEDYIINKFIELCIVTPLMLSIFLGLIYYFLSNIFFKSKSPFFSFVPVIFFLASIFILLNNLSFFNWINHLNNETDFIKSKYIKPNQITLNSQKDNLILIYVESLEKTFSDKKIFQEDLIYEINESSLNGKSIKYFNETKYTNWTIAAIVASQCGLPLKPIGILDTKKRGKHQKHVFGLKTFLPNAKCIGDILKENNYKNIFINGVDLNFVGTGLFFRNHGYDELYDKNIFTKKMLKFEPNSWGGAPHDSFLFNFAKKKILELKNDDKPFNLTILTTDTHAPYGYLDQKCQKNGSKFDSVVKCTSKTIRNFVDFVKNEIPNNTKIVIIGDHLFPEGNKINISTENKFRDIYNMFISYNDFNFNRDEINHYDLFPTILNFMNFEFDQNKLGLGFSALKNFNENDYNNHIKYLNENIQNKSKYYQNFYK